MLRSRGGVFEISLRNARNQRRDHQVASGLGGGHDLQERCQRLLEHARNNCNGITDDRDAVCKRDQRPYR